MKPGDKAWYVCTFHDIWPATVMVVVNDFVVIQPDISDASPMTVPVASNRLHSDPIAASAHVVQSLEREMDGLAENQDRVKSWVDAGAKGSFTAIFEE